MFSSLVQPLILCAIRVLTLRMCHRWIRWKSLMQDFIARGGTIWACPPCVKARGYVREDFIDGVTIQGASAMHERLKATRLPIIHPSPHTRHGSLKGNGKGSNFCMPSQIALGPG